MTFPFFDLTDAEAFFDVSNVAAVGKRTQARYVFSRELSHAVSVALLLGDPLLVTGEPGTGKSALAAALGRRFGVPIHRFETQSTSEARDLFYTFDAQGSYKRPDITDARSFVAYGALGKAILETMPAEEVAYMLPPDATHPTPRRSVVLIDEIDKAPRDFPNDLLNAIERLVFTVSETGATSPADDDGTRVPENLRPIIVITSNSEKALPDPFLRRCIYHNIAFPGKERMAEIVDAHDLGVPVASTLVRSAMDLFYRLRDTLAVGGKPPTTSEFVAWLLVLRADGAPLDEPLSADLAERTLGVIIKTEADTELAHSVLYDWRSGDGED